MTESVSPTSAPAPSEVHLCDSYSHLLIACADLAAGVDDRDRERPLVLYIDDRLPLDDELAAALASATGAEIVRVSDAAAIDAYATLPRVVPGMLRRNISWPSGPVPKRPWSWSPAELAHRHFDVGYVYNAGFFLSKVVAGHCDEIVLRDSGYANYVHHLVPWKRAVPRLLAGRSPRHQVWGEERWVDRIEVVRPDRVPERVRHKASRVTLDDLMGRLPSDRARTIAQCFWGDRSDVEPSSPPAALLLTQPIDQLGMCSTADKLALYASIAERVRARGLSITVKPHQREQVAAVPDAPRIPAAFPIEAWTWLGRPAFELAVSLNSASLADTQVSFARHHLQLIPPERFYAHDWPQWEHMIATSLASWADDPASMSRDAPDQPHLHTP